MRGIYGEGERREGREESGREGGEEIEREKRDRDG